MIDHYSCLHCHTELGSLLDAVSKVKDVVKRCKETGIKACAITDHASISGHISFNTDLIKAGIKPILGCEFNIGNPGERKNWHILLLAKNLDGWKTLVKIISASNLKENFYYKPRLSLDKLLGMLDGNIIGIAGHLGSIFDAAIFDEHDNIRSDAVDEGVALIKGLENSFGKGNFFAEIQLITQTDGIGKRLAYVMREIADRSGIKPVATCDAHYPTKENANDQHVLLCNKFQTTLAQIMQKIQTEEEVSLACFFQSKNFHIPTLEEMSVLHTEEELANTNLVADLCEEYKLAKSPQLPTFKNEFGLTSAEYVRKLCREGWVKRQNKIDEVIKELGYTKEDYGKRFEMELAVLEKANLMNYFLIVWDIVRYYKEELGGLTISSRGSAAGSLILYLMGVSEIDPLQYDLLFERFYNAGRNTKDRISLPDIDLDVESNKREQLMEYIKSQYGHSCVAQIATFGRMQGRSAIKDVLRVHNACTFEEMNEITRWIPDESKIIDDLQEMKEEDKVSGGDGEASIIEWALEHHKDKLAKWVEYDENHQLVGLMAKNFEQAIRLEGTRRSIGKHAAGIIISNTPLAEVCPMIYDSKTEQPMIGFDMHDAETIGLVKMDLLGLSLLDKLHHIQDDVNNDS
jgi:DNA polymerase III subunit alpha